MLSHLHASCSRLGRGAIGSLRLRGRAGVGVGTFLTGHEDLRLRRVNPGSQGRRRKSSARLITGSASGLSLFPIGGVQYTDSSNHIRPDRSNTDTNSECSATRITRSNFVAAWGNRDPERLSLSANSATKHYLVVLSLASAPNVSGEMPVCCHLRSTRGAYYATRPVSKPGRRTDDVQPVVCSILSVSENENNQIESL